MYLLYDSVLFIAAFVLIPYYLIRGLRRGKMRRGLRERLGFYPVDRLAALDGKKVIWIHAVSVGETRAAIPLVKALKRLYPDYALLLSNVTETGHQIAAEIAEVDLCLFFPFDFSRVVQRVLKRVNPALVIIVETEIWPNFVRIARGRNIPVILANGRISDRSFPRYRLIRPWLKPILDHFSAFCMQSEQDAERIRTLGASPDKVVVTRNIKFDMAAPVPDEAMAAAIRADFHLPADHAVWVAGSTHAGEEEILGDCFRQLVQEGRKLVLVLVPRHPERCRSVADALEARELPVVWRSAIGSLHRSLRTGEILLVDTVGEMLKFYASADLVFVGGSFVRVGGHNVLEAALLKKPALFGPFTHNFKEITSLLLADRAGVRVDDERDLVGKVRTLLDDPARCAAMGARGKALLERNAGATDQTVAVVRQILA